MQLVINREPNHITFYRLLIFAKNKLKTEKIMKLPKYITIQIKDRNGRLNKKPYKGTFKHKNKIYYCGAFETIRQAQVSVDKKRIYLGLEPLVLKKQNN